VVFKVFEEISEGENKEARICVGQMKRMNKKQQDLLQRGRESGSG
jgi:hypothetical protein